MTLMGRLLEGVLIFQNEEKNMRVVWLILQFEVLDYINFSTLDWENLGIFLTHITHIFWGSSHFLVFFSVKTPPHSASQPPPPRSVGGFTSLLPSCLAFQGKSHRVLAYPYVPFPSSTCSYLPRRRVACFVYWTAPIVCICVASV